MRALKATVGTTGNTLRVNDAVAPTSQDNNLERAADWVFSHAGELDAMETEPVAAAGPQYRDGVGSK